MKNKYFVYCTEDGYETFKTKQEAIISATSRLEDARDYAITNGWPEETCEIVWGEITQRATKINEKETPCGFFDDECDYELKR